MDTPSAPPPVEPELAVAIKQKIQEIRVSIDNAARDCGRDPADVRLMVVSKMQDAGAIEAVVGAGHRLFGENRVQEAQAKWPDLRARYPDIELHLIGSLQTNKVADAVALFDVIQTVDRPKLAAAIARAAAAQQRKPRCYLQINTGAESQKGGVAPEAADAFIADCRAQHGLMVEGLMCIPPVDEEPALHFALLADIARRNGVVNLSMGMSADYEIAVAFGATLVRLGTAIFGPRPAG